MHPQPETYWGNVSPIGPRSCYDEAKRFSEAITMAYHRVHGLDVRIARIFNTYGERMRPDDGRVVNTLVVQALRGEPITLHGDGSQTRSFCHVSRRDRRPGRRARRPRHRPDQRRQPQRVHDPPAGRAGRRADRIRSSEIITVPLPPNARATQRSADPTSRLISRLYGWARRSNCREGLTRMISWFRTAEGIG